MIAGKPRRYWLDVQARAIERFAIEAREHLLALDTDPTNVAAATAARTALSQIANFWTSLDEHHLLMTGHSKKSLEQRLLKEIAAKEPS